MTTRYGRPTQDGSIVSEVTSYYSPTARRGLGVQSSDDNMSPIDVKGKGKVQAPILNEKDNGEGRAPPVEEQTPSTTKAPLVDEKVEDEQANVPLPELVPGRKRSTACIWLIILLAVCTVLAVILGAVLGTRASRRSRNASSSRPDDGTCNIARYTSCVIPTSTPVTLDARLPTITSTTLVAATPIPITSTYSLPSLPLGVMRVYNPGPPDATSTCLPSAQQTAWKCASSYDEYGIAIIIHDGFTASLRLAVDPNQTPNDTTVNFPPNLSPQDMVIVAAQQPGVTTNPTYHFQTTYDRRVALPASTFRVPNITLDDAHAWHCWWNATVLETFLDLTHPGVPVPERISSANGSAPFFPYRLQVLEQREPYNHGRPYCDYVQLSGPEGRDATQVRDAGGNVVRIGLDEDYARGGCSCLWTS